MVERLSERMPITCQDCGEQDMVDPMQILDWMDAHPCTSPETMKKKRKAAREGLHFPC